MYCQQWSNWAEKQTRITSASLFSASGRQRMVRAAHLAIRNHWRMGRLTGISLDTFAIRINYCSSPNRRRANSRTSNLICSAFLLLTSVNSTPTRRLRRIFRTSPATRNRTPFTFR
jgi:hypothetical protein